jgi:hypothetical protein
MPIGRKWQTHTKKSQISASHRKGRKMHSASTGVDKSRFAWENVKT